MTTQSNASSSIEGAPRQYFNWLSALAILILGIGLGVFASNLAIASKTDVSVAPQRVTRNSPARPNLLEMEKKALIATAEQRNQAIAAEAARYTSLGLFYAAGNEANVQRGIEAEAARYNGLAGFYGAAKTLVWPPRPTQLHPAEEAGPNEDIGLMEFSAIN